MKSVNMGWMEKITLSRGYVFKLLRIFLFISFILVMVSSGSYATISDRMTIRGDQFLNSSSNSYVNGNFSTNYSLMDDYGGAGDKIYSFIGVTEYIDGEIFYELRNINDSFDGVRSICVQPQNELEFCGNITSYPYTFRTNYSEYVHASGIISGKFGTGAYEFDDNLTIAKNLSVDSSVLFVDSTNDRVGIGISSPDSILHIKADFPGWVGNNYAGQIIIQNPANSVTSNVVITAYDSDSDGNPDQQLWYLGSASTGNSDITFLNRRNANLKFGTNDNTRMTISYNGNVGIGTTSPTEELNVIGNVNFTGNLTYKTIYAQLSDSKDQTFPIINIKQPINLTTTDEYYGIAISVYNITIQTSGIYDIAAQPQVATGAGGAGKFHMWLEKYTGGVWINVSNSNVELVLASNEENVIPLIATLKLLKDEKIRVMGSVSDIQIKLDAQTPTGEPTIPSIIFRIIKLG